MGTRGGHAAELSLAWPEFIDPGWYSLGNYCFIYYAEMDYPVQGPGMQFLLVLLFCAVNIFSSPTKLCLSRCKFLHGRILWQQGLRLPPALLLCVNVPVSRVSNPLDDAKAAPLKCKILGTNIFRAHN